MVHFGATAEQQGKACTDEAVGASSFKTISHLLEECRMVLPGIQALFGFQLIAVFNQPFGPIGSFTPVASFYRDLSRGHLDGPGHDPCRVSPSSQGKVDDTALYCTFFPTPPVEHVSTNDGDMCGCVLNRDNDISK